MYVERGDCGHNALLKGVELRFLVSKNHEAY